MRGRRRPGYGVRLGSNPARRGRGAAGRAIAELELRQEGVPPTWRTAGPPPPTRPCSAEGLSEGPFPRLGHRTPSAGAATPSPPPGAGFSLPSGLHPGAVRGWGGPVEPPQPGRAEPGRAEPGRAAGLAPASSPRDGTRFFPAHRFPNKPVPSALPARVRRLSRSPGWPPNPNGCNTRIREVMIFITELAKNDRPSLETNWAVRNPF